MPRNHLLSAEELKAMRHQHRIGRVKLKALATAYGYAHRSGVRNAILAYEASKGLTPDQIDDEDAPRANAEPSTGA